MKKIKKVSLMLTLLAGILLLTACSGTKTVVYEGDMEGVTAKATVDYDKNENVQKVIQEIKMDFGSLVSKSDLEEMAKESGEEYEDTKGVTYKYSIKDTELTMSMTYELKSMSEEDKENEFGNFTDDKGNVKLEKMTDSFEEEGLTKK